MLVVGRERILMTSIGVDGFEWFLAVSSLVEITMVGLNNFLVLQLFLLAKFWLHAGRTVHQDKSLLPSSTDHLFD